MSLAALGVSSDTYYCPRWYALVQAAKYLGVAPWELVEQSVYWQDRAILAMNAEAQARKTIQNRK